MLLVVVWLWSTFLSNWILVAKISLHFLHVRKEEKTIEQKLAVLVLGLMMARTSWTSWAADGHPFKPARPLSNLFNPLYTARGGTKHCALRARTFNHVMEFLDSQPNRHTTRICVCSFAPASTHRQIDDFGFYSKTCLFCLWWNFKETAAFFT